MTSREFAEDHPSLSEAEAERLVLAHGHDPAEARDDLGAAFTTTADLLGWLGY
ncbi:hypothetical protein [Paracoccus laeviglucosivorans]|uniref:Uncharacterized protein n=1 Tax=Paracoccus laeviglucosivorans TaxID=1197861 RepID=A0A521FUA8_9RHOB|nr:hypothetical protein [Paracoccus laeviglucosivorans]SMO99160.1 hypothetical protein SAMN06265221_1412 [Paracoccus laeviglucosivorans]